MKSTKKTWLLVTFTVLAGILCTVWLNSPGRSNQSGGRKILFYQDSMHPWVKSDRPGKCTICAMDLTPIAEGEKGFGADENVVALSSNSITVLHVQTEEVKRQPLSRTLRVAGTLEANESRKTIVSAPVACRIQSLAVPYTGVEVEEGQSLLTLYSPELAQKRAYLSALGASYAGPTNHLVQAKGKADPFSSDLLAPQSGTIVERNVSSGQYVTEGEKLMTIVDSSVLWFRFDVYGRQLPWFKPGQTIEVAVEGVPESTLQAVVSFIEPTLNDATRTVKVRADIKNPVVSTNGHPQRLLRFGLYAEGLVQAEIPSVLGVPRSAILYPGGTAYAYVDKGDGAYERRVVKLGRQGDELWEILQGLEAGDRVVTSGNVLIDAQAEFNQGGKPDSAGADAMASTGSKQTAPAVGAALYPAAQKALGDFLAVADGISQALAADSMKQLKPHTDALPKVVASLVKQLGEGHPLHELIEHLAAATQWPTPKDLAAARKTFLPFSSNVVELVQRVRGQEEVFRSLKVYHCPMAPKPGLWFQAKGPLRNPYFGAEMLSCGKEVPLVIAAVSRPAAPANTGVAASARVAHSAPEAAASKEEPAPNPASMTHLESSMFPTTMLKGHEPAGGASVPASRGAPPEKLAAPSKPTEVTPTPADRLKPAAPARASCELKSDRMATRDEMPKPKPSAPAEAAAALDEMPISTNKEAFYGEFDQNRKALNDDMRKRWLAGIAEAEKQKPAPKAPSAVSLASATPPVQPIASTPPASAKRMTEAATARPSAEEVQGRVDIKFGRMVAKDELTRMRMTALAEAAANNQKAAELTPFTAAQRQALEAFLAEVDDVSRALAADDLKQYNQHVAHFAKVLPAMEKELAASQRWGPAIFRVLALGQGIPPKTLADARNRFLPFGTAMVELAKLLKRQDSAFAELKMYHCPMAPKPGLWLQTKGPLRNPYFGAEMLEVGEEVLVSAAPSQPVLEAKATPPPTSSALPK